MGNASKRFAAGSGSDWPGLEGDPDVAVGAIILVGEHRNDDSTRGFCNPSISGRHPVGLVRRVMKDHGRDRPSRIRYVEVDGVCEGDPVWVRARDCVCLVRADGARNAFGGLLSYLDQASCVRFHSRQLVPGHAAVEWAQRAGLLVEQPDGTFAAPAPLVQALEAGVKAVLSGAVLAQWSPMRQEQAINRVARGTPAESVVCKEIGAESGQSATIEGVLYGPGQTEGEAAKLKVVARPDGVVDTTVVEHKTVKPPELPKPVKFDGGEQIIATPPVVAFALRGLVEQMDRSRYVGPHPVCVVRALAMITLAACKGRLEDNERRGLEREATRGDHGCDRETAWHIAKNDFDTLYKLFTPRWWIDARPQAAIEEQLRWLAEQDPTTPRRAAPDDSGERERAWLGKWLRAPLS